MPAVFEASREQSADRERVNAGAKAVGLCSTGGRHYPTRGHNACTYDMARRFVVAATVATSPPNNSPILQ